jgi:paraquat-inducible protein B
MNTSTENEAPKNQTDIAKPIVRKKRWPYSLIWIFPVLAAIVAGLYFRDYIATKGETITIEFLDASGMMVKETKLKYRGAEIGRVTGIHLSEDHKHAVVTAELEKRDGIFASKGAVFWVVRPEVSETGLQGLGTILTGPYISAIPGEDKEDKTEFIGMNEAPRPYEAGEKFVLTTVKLGHVQDGSAVYYKNIPVGSVQEIQLAKDADHVDVHIVVWTRYAELVRQNSKFWVASGLDFKGGLFSGAELKLGSMRALISGGINFATPEKNTGAIAKNGTHFAIDEDPKKDWDKWSPHLKVSPRGSDSEQAPAEMPGAHKEKEKE